MFLRNIRNNDANNNNSTNIISITTISQKDDDTRSATKDYVDSFSGIDRNRGDLSLKFNDQDALFD